MAETQHHYDIVNLYFGQLHAYGQNLGHLLHGQIVLEHITMSPE